MITGAGSLEFHNGGIGIGGDPLVDLDAHILDGIGSDVLDAGRCGLWFHPY